MGHCHVPGYNLPAELLSVTGTSRRGGCTTRGNIGIAIHCHLEVCLTKPLLLILRV